MSRRGRLDVAIVGGGVVGTAAALALAKLGLDVALVEGAEPTRWLAERPDLRVYAFAPDNVALLDEFGLWRDIMSARAQPYRQMRVWDAAGGGELAFDADAFGRRELGWIVEHNLLVDRLWAALPDAGVHLHCPARVQGLEQDEDGVRLQLDDGARIDARIALAADGAKSTLRGLAGLEVDRHDYLQCGLVAYVATEQPHQETAWQRFLPGGPLALLPCTDIAGDSAAAKGCRSSIVWTLPEDEASRLLALDEVAFNRELTRAFDAHLGQTTLLSARAAFPLRRQLVRDYVRGRVLVLGDAAHVVHPLAGQGVNLGLRDVVALRDAIVAALAARADWTAPSRLARWARTRASENAMAAHIFDGINRVFSSDSVVATLLRGPVLGLAGRVPPLAQIFWRRASGT
jgi:2-octaprenyl-3-methyl-6-methoxy-1,4-benzoquinol hydroxylase